MANVEENRDQQQYQQQYDYGQEPARDVNRGNRPRRGSQPGWQGQNPNQNPNWNPGWNNGPGYQGGGEYDPSGHRQWQGQPGWQGQGDYGSMGQGGRGDWRGQGSQGRYGQQTWPDQGGQQQWQGQGGWPAGWEQRRAWQEGQSGQRYPGGREREGQEYSGGGDAQGYVGQNAYQDWRQGPYAGRGPHGYQRSDERIREDIADRMTQHGQLDATNVEIAVSGGVVTLQGSVNSRNEKRLAEDLTESVPGVRDVNNTIKVNQSLWGQVKDALTPGDQPRQQTDQTTH